MPFQVLVRSFLVAIAAVTVSACGGGAADGGPGTPAIAVVVQPPAATVPVGGGVAFTAAVTSSVDTSVIWSVEPSGCGSVTQSGDYAAPATAGTCTVRATSRADPTRSGNATVTVTASVGPPPDPIAPSVRVELVPQAGVSGPQRVNFALPMPPGHLQDSSRVRIAAVPGTGAELAAARRVLATWPDGSIRSVQLQVDVDVPSTTALDVEIGTGTTAGSLARSEVADTLAVADGTTGPRVWAVLPATWLAPSQVAGPVVAQSAIAGTPLDAWGGVCDYATWDIDAFLAQAAGREAWLFDRPTAMYLGYAMTGARVALESGYREAAMYRAGITGTGSATRIGVPTAADDLKYHYTQGLAIHYLLTGDDRFREAAENVAIRAHDLWPSPGYAGGADFWTERHAGFALLAYEWAAAVSDDRASTFAPWADQAVAAYLAMQAVGANAWEPDARCFAHSADAHGESYGYVGCSPWMSAILADGLDAYSRRVGGAGATAARQGLVLLGRMIARHGRDAVGRPYYWMGAGVNAAEADPYDEHWGESAYVVALAWHWGGRSDTGLRTAAMELIDGLRTRGEAGQLRSFNWQCRSAPMAAYFLRQ
jgi:hypothetical protein